MKSEKRTVKVTKPASLLGWLLRGKWTTKNGLTLTTGNFVIASCLCASAKTSQPIGIVGKKEGRKIMVVGVF